jgi:hypothetical protein
LAIADHLHDCRFGTFLFNNEKERKKEDIGSKAPSLWDYLRWHFKDFVSPFFQSQSPPRSSFLPPRSALLRSVSLWQDFFLRYSTTHLCTPPPPPLGSREEELLACATRLDMPGCTKGDLSLPHAVLASSDWDSMVQLKTEEVEKWRRKALGAKMESLHSQGSLEGPPGEFGDLPAANSEIVRLRAELAAAKGHL